MNNESVLKKEASKVFTNFKEIMGTIFKGIWTVIFRLLLTLVAVLPLVFLWALVYKSHFLVSIFLLIVIGVLYVLIFSIYITYGEEKYDNDNYLLVRMNTWWLVLISPLLPLIAKFPIVYWGHGEVGWGMGFLILAILIFGGTIFFVIAANN